MGELQLPGDVSSPRLHRTIVLALAIHNMHSSFPILCRAIWSSKKPVCLLAYGKGMRSERPDKTDNQTLWSQI